VVFHYAGHGAAIPDDNGDELDDGNDKATLPLWLRPGHGERVA
jgi:hypothetical protein